jgi:hypothetical protein
MCWKQSHSLIMARRNRINSLVVKNAPLIMRKKFNCLNQDSRNIYFLGFNLKAPIPIKR